ncbi:MAG TPA: hypothetical protein VGE37_15095, partial [Archangium sp.]
ALAAGGAVMNQRPLADFVKPPEPSTASLHLEWHEVRRRVRRHRQVRVAAIAAAVLVLVGVVAAVAVRSARETLATGSAVAALETPKNVWLKEGSQIAVAPQSELSLVAQTESDVLCSSSEARRRSTSRRSPRGSSW